MCSLYTGVFVAFFVVRSAKIVAKRDKNKLFICHFFLLLLLGSKRKNYQPEICLTMFGSGALILYVTEKRILHFTVLWWCKEQNPTEKMHFTQTHWKWSKVRHYLEVITLFARANVQNNFQLLFFTRKAQDPFWRATQPLSLTLFFVYTLPSRFLNGECVSFCKVSCCEGNSIYEIAKTLCSYARTHPNTKCMKSPNA